MKEFREFFLRNVQVSSGAKQDQESGYTLTNIVKGLTKFNRFLKGNYPSEGVFSKLFESITFKLNPEDTATSSQQGLVKKSTDAIAISRTLNLDNDMTIAVVPHQLPNIVTVLDSDDTAGTPVTTGNVTITPITRDLGNGRTKRNFLIQVAESTGSTTGKYIAANFSTSSTTFATIGNGANLLRVNLLANKTYKFEVLLFVTPNAGAAQKVQIISTVTASTVIGEIVYINDATLNVDYKSKITSLGVPIIISGSDNGIIKIQGTLSIINAGTVEIAYAQNTPSGNSLVLAGSSITIQELIQ